MPIEYDVHRDHESTEFDRKTVTLTESIFMINEQIGYTHVTKTLNPIYQELRKWFGIKNMTAY
jgi:hypothetical protein